MQHASGCIVFKALPHAQQMLSRAALLMASAVDALEAPIERSRDACRTGGAALLLRLLQPLTERVRSRRP